jgi:Icc-related predicted phosphoesterase
MARHKIKIVWDTIPENTDIVVTHGPPQGVLDLSINKDRELEFCGCTALKNRLGIINPKLSLFGHIHNNKNIKNSGLLTHSDGTTIYSNGTVVEDGKMQVFNNGNIIEL